MFLPSPPSSSPSPRDGGGQSGQKKNTREKTGGGLRPEPTATKKGQKEKKIDGQKSAAFLPVYAPYYLDAIIRARKRGENCRPITKMKIDSKEIEKKKPDEIYLMEKDTKRANFYSSIVEAPFLFCETLYQATLFYLAAK